MFGTYTESESPDQTAHAQSDQGLCSPLTKSLDPVQNGSRKDNDPGDTMQDDLI